MGLVVGAEAEGDGDGEGLGETEGAGVDAGAEIVKVTWGREPPGDVTLNDLVVFLTV